MNYIEYGLNFSVDDSNLFSHHRFTLTGNEWDNRKSVIF